jgi:sulfur-carrier protein
LAITVHVAGHLRDKAGGSTEVRVDGARDVLDLIRRLEARFPDLRDRVLDEHDRTRPYINIFVNERDIRELRGESTEIRDGDVIYILPSVAGGKAGLAAEAVEEGPQG